MDDKKKLEELHELNIEFINSMLEIRKQADKRRDLRHGVFGGAFVALFGTVLQAFNPINPWCLLMIGGAVIGSIATAVVYKKTPSEHSMLAKLVDKCPEYKERLEELKAQMGKEYTAEEGLRKVGSWLRKDITKLEDKIEREEREIRMVDDNHAQTIEESMQPVVKTKKVDAKQDLIEDLDR